MLIVLSRIWALISGSKFLWDLISNYSVLSENFKAIEKVLEQVMSDSTRRLPDHNESQILLIAVSNILKTGVIDLPGVDEMQIAIGLDHINQNMVISIQDKKSGKYAELPILTAKEN